MPSEHWEQRELVKWFRQTYPHTRIFSVPNGAAVSPAQAARLKVEGLSAGVPDLCVPEWSLWIEMKRQEGGRLSAKQKDWIEYLEEVGHTVIVGKGWEDARAQVLRLPFLEKNGL